MGFKVIKSVIRSDVYEDEDGNIIDSKPNKQLYHTLYHYLILLSILINIKDLKKIPGKSTKVWKAVSLYLEGKDANTFKIH